MRNEYKISFLLMVSLVLIAHGPFSSLSEYGGNACIVGQEKNTTRILTENNYTGGFWYDDFRDNLGIYNISNLNKLPYGISLNEMIFEEDFESYSGGTDLFSTGSWARHLTMNAGTFTADISRPHNAVTNTIGNHYNGATSPHSVILSEKFDVEKGQFQIWTATNKIDTGYDSTTGFWLMGDDNDAPTSADRIFATSFTSGGYDIFNGQWHSVAEGLSINTWYRVVINFDCTIEKADIFIYDTQGVLLGSIINFDYLNSFPSVKRVRMIAGQRNDGVYMNSYWDDMFLVDIAPNPSGEIISNPIDLPLGYKWSVLKVNKDEGMGSSITLDILDESFNPISGISYSPLDDQVDISGLCEIGITSIRLKATFTPSGLRSPILKGWGVEWNDTDVWSDHFLTSLKLNGSINARVEDMFVRLIDQSQIGYMESIPISIPSGYLWYNLYTDSTYVLPSSISIDILDPLTGEPIEGYSDRTSATMDLSGLDPIGHPSIILRAEIDNNSLTEVRFNSWAVDWITNEPPIVLGLD
ncbi:MAG: hypothetical protein KAH57_11610, partial [Thermoplasmata archaeon]|nr:hypothetical protein [Thermoplasmata archaeon]